MKGLLTYDLFIFSRFLINFWMIFHKNNFASPSSSESIFKKNPPQLESKVNNTIVC